MPSETRVPTPVEPAGIYLHIPFCVAKCIYCDFCSFAGQEGLHAAYADSLIAQIRAIGAQSAGIRYDTLYVGGGTPTVLPSARLIALLAACREALALPKDAEVTVEANPGTVTQASLAELAHGGYNRLSLGVQSLRDHELTLLGRIHNREQALEAVAAARAAGFTNVSLDLIYGLPYQTQIEWRATLEEVLALAPEHLSLYALTVEEDTPLRNRIARGDLPAPDDDCLADMYELAQELLARGGYVQYEISNWARRSVGDRPGEPPALASHHNLHYWRAEPYLGLGAGAHGYDGQRRYAQGGDPEEYVRRVASNEVTQESSETVGQSQAMDETLMLGLRLAQGVTWDSFRQRFGVELQAVYAEALDGLADTGLLERDAVGIRLAPRGYLLANQVLVAFMRGAP